MRIFRGLPTQDKATPCALTIGNFDGVHRGHVELLQRVKQEAILQDMASVVLTFNPHPRQYFALRAERPLEVPPTIYSLRSKLAAIAEIGIERSVLLRFDQKLVNLTAQDFIKTILVDGLNVRWLIVGEAFLFGKNRRGTTSELLLAGKKYGFQVEVMPAVMENGVRISSSSVREALMHNDFVRAEKLLGKPYHISGHVAHGDKRGKMLGFPTANLSVRRFNPILSGVFITLVHGLGDKPLPAVSMIGTRPSIDEQQRIVLETHILNYAQDCYGALIHVEFLEKIRENQKFVSMTALSEAIGQDIEKAHSFFTSEQNATWLSSKKQI
jgi:riboflavin kinase/FMN adenylyltransferase